MIEPKRVYSLSEVVRMNIFNDIRDYRAVKDRILEDDNNSIIKMKKVGKGRSAKYFIKGENLLKFLNNKK